MRRMYSYKPGLRFDKKTFQGNQQIRLGKEGTIVPPGVYSFMPRPNLKVGGELVANLLTQISVYPYKKRAQKIQLPLYTTQGHLYIAELVYTGDRFPAVIVKDLTGNLVEAFEDRKIFFSLECIGTYEA